MAEQERYQVRFDWGAAGLAAVGTDADVVVLVDAVPGTPLPDVGGCPGAVLLTGFRTARAVGRWVLETQQVLGRRIVVAVVAVGAPREGGGERFAVEDLLAAGAVVGALGEEGLDATSPEAAIVEAAYRGLRRGVGHLVSASAAVPPVVARVEEDLGPADVTVLRAHPALPLEDSAEKSSASEFMQ